MNIIIIPHLPTYNSRGFYLAREFAIKDDTHFIMWDMPYPLTIKKIIENIQKSLFYKESLIDGIHIHKLSRLPFFFPFANSILFKSQIKKIHKKYSIDYIISQSFFNETEPPLELPFVYDMVDDYEAFAEIYGSKMYKLGYKLLGVHGAIKRQILNSIFVTCVSDKIITSVKKYRKNGIYKIQNGVEDWALNINMKPGKPFSLIYVTYISKWSNIDMLLKVITELKKNIYEIKLTIVGEGPYYKEVEVKIKKLDLVNNVFIKTIHNRNDLFETINKHAICLNIGEKNDYRDASSPLKIFEYSALGKKIISIDLDEVKNLQFSNILFYKKNTIKELTEKIYQAFLLKNNPKKIKEKVKKYRWSQHVKLLKNLIKEA